MQRAARALRLAVWWGQPAASRSSTSTLVLRDFLLLTGLPTYLPTYLPTHLPTCSPTYLRTRTYTSLPLDRELPAHIGLVATTSADEIYAHFLQRRNRHLMAEVQRSRR